MKKSVVLLACLLFFQNSYAQELVFDDSLGAEDIHFHEPLEKVKISEINNYLRGTQPGVTCMDEYIKRRRQLLVKFTLTPITLTAATAASFFVGGLAGIGIGNAVLSAGATNDPWAILGYAVGGVMVGTATSVILVTADTASSGMNYYDNDLLLKALGEYYLDRQGPKIQKLYEKVTKKMAIKPSQDEFIQKLIELDESERLCDGSLVKQPRFKLGSKLKYKLARPNDLKSVI